MKVVVGLGNPGEKYAATRHNIGFLIVDALAEAAGRAVKLSECQALTGRIQLAGASVLLVKPQTYMNLSGQAVAALCAKHDADPTTDLLVVVDDVALPFGKLRLRPQGSAGGHNGLKSLIAKLGTQQFSRLRVGIQPEHQIGDLADFVLAKFNAVEQKELRTVIDTARDAVETWTAQGIDAAMMRFN